MGKSFVRMHARQGAAGEKLVKKAAQRGAAARKTAEKPYAVRAVSIAAAFALCALLACATACSTKPGYVSDEAGADIVKDASADRPQPEYVDAPDAQAVTIDDSGWWAMDGYVDYGIHVTNPNADLVACNTQVHVTLYSENGTAANDYTQTIGEIGPGETVGFAGEVGDGLEPASVSIELVSGTTQWTSGEGYADPITIESCNEQDKGYFRYELTGDFTNNTDYYVSTVNLYALLIADDGTIAAGYPATAYKCKSGQTKSYLQTIDSAPDHARVELYAQVAN